MRLKQTALLAGFTGLLTIGNLAATQVMGASQAPGASSGSTVSGMPPIVDPSNVYSETGAGHLSPEVQQHHAVPIEAIEETTFDGLGDAEKVWVEEAR